MVDELMAPQMLSDQSRPVNARQVLAGEGIFHVLKIRRDPAEIRSRREVEIDREIDCRTIRLLHLPGKFQGPVRVFYPVFGAEILNVTAVAGMIRRPRPLLEDDRDHKAGIAQSAQFRRGQAFGRQ